MRDETKTDLSPMSFLHAAAGEPALDPGAHIDAVADALKDGAKTQGLMARSAARQAEAISSHHMKRLHAGLEALADSAHRLAGAQDPSALFAAMQAYIVDRAQRMALTADALRERGDIFLSHETAGCPPVLAYDYDIVMDGADLPRPCNYVLMRIRAPEGVETRETKRPYVIIDPRAGHGAGIGGFKNDSQVGVALADGHPVYFVGFRRDPEPGQTLADVTRAEAAFVREVRRLHPDSPNPVVVGNCQGGWATLLLAATNPDLTGPIVLNGAPVAPWSGEVGKNPMRYNGGILGGTWQPMFWSDLGGGVFDGAHLVQNFEMLNPSRNYFGKYYDLFNSIDHGKQRFLEFERWWGGFFKLNEEEIRWIVENLFVGNKLARNEAHLEPGRVVDVKAVRSPIIVFASHGDNITPPQQALNWIVDAYADVQEIKIRGQRIIYMVHEEVGHLGIFVSSSIAKKEHTEVTSTMKTIEALPPGLYEMKIDAAAGEGRDRTFMVSFAERSLRDIEALDDGREDEEAFAAVARLSAAQAEFYDVMARPLVRAMVSPPVAKAAQALHPLRTQRAMVSSRNPFMAPVEAIAEAVAAQRAPAPRDNPFVMMEQAMAGMVAQSIDLMRDARDAMYEAAFFAMWGTPAARAFGRPRAARRTLKSLDELRALPEVQAALAHVSDGGFEEAVVRMLVMLADSRGAVRRDRLERSARVLTQDAPFSRLTMDQRARMIQEQTLIAEFEPELAIRTLPDLLPDAAARALAARVVRYVPGPTDEMAPRTLETLRRFHEALGLPMFTDDVLEDPLAGAALEAAQ